MQRILRFLAIYSKLKNKRDIAKKTKKYRRGEIQLAPIVEASVLADVFAHNLALQELDVRFNKITKNGIQSLKATCTVKCERLHMWLL